MKNLGDFVRYSKHIGDDQTLYSICTLEILEGMGLFAGQPIRSGNKSKLVAQIIAQYDVMISQAILYALIGMVDGCRDRDKWRNRQEIYREAIETIVQTDDKVKRQLLYQ